MVVDEALEFRQAIPKTKGPTYSGLVSTSINTLKINVDIGSFFNGSTGFGMLIRNHHGVVLFAACNKIEH